MNIDLSQPLAYFNTWEGRYVLLLLVVLAATLLASLAAETRALADQWDDDDNGLALQWEYMPEDRPKTDESVLG